MTPMRLLVVDDSPTIRKVVELSFRNTPVSVEFAVNGTDGLARAMAEPGPDVILLDCVLPDMKAMEACQRLAELLRNAGLEDRERPGNAGAARRVVLMSAKERASLEEVFERFSWVVDFLGKPFTAEDLRARVQAAAQRTAGPAMPAAARRATPAAPVPAVPRPNVRPAPVAAPSLAAAPPAVRPEAADAGDPNALLQGSTRGFGSLSLLRAVEQEGRTGELVLGLGDRRLVTYWDSGELVLCTSHDPREYVGESSSDELAGVTLEARQSAEAEQRTSGTPVYVTLADGQAAAGNERLVALLAERSARLLQTVLRAPQLRFLWRDRPLPAYVQTLGRPLSLENGALVEAPAATPTSLAQVELERLRRPSAWPLAGMPAAAPEDSYDRASSFGAKLKALRLTASEQRVLSLVTRQNSLQAIAQQTGLALREVTRILGRLEAIDLVQRASRAASAASSTRALPQAVMVLDTDLEGFCRPLRDRLARLSHPIHVFDLSEEDDIPMAIARERPGLVVLNESAAPGRLVTIARAVRAMPHLASTALLALVAEDAGSADFLAAAGFDAVWSKPVHLPDLYALLPLEVQLASASP